MTDRRALVVGSWLGKGRDRPSPQKVRSLMDRWSKIFAANSSYNYRYPSLKKKDTLPAPLTNPTKAKLTDQLLGAQGVTEDTELLFYFVGHSVSDGENDIQLILGLDSEGQDKTISLTWLLNTIYGETQIQKLVVILDTCHAGRTRDVFRLKQELSFAMFATGDTYAFDANFSDGLLLSFERPIRKSDQRIDRHAGGVTYQRIFEVTRLRAISRIGGSKHKQDPECFGDYGGAVIREVPVAVPRGFNDFVSSRSIYGRVFRLLELIRETDPSFNELHAAVGQDPVFLLRREASGPDRHISGERLSEYLDFLRIAKWVVQPKGCHQLTPSGRSACDTAMFNTALLEAIENEVFPEDMSFEELEDVVMELLMDMIPPTPIRISDRFGMKGKVLKLNTATRVAIQLLPSTGRFLKGAAYAIFPSELGG